MPSQVANISGPATNNSTTQSSSKSNPSVPRVPTNATLKPAVARGKSSVISQADGNSNSAPEPSVVPATRPGGSSRPQGTKPLPQLPKGVKRYSKEDKLELNRNDQLLVGMSTKEFLVWAEEKKAREEEIKAAIERDWVDVGEGKKKKNGETGKRI